MKLEILFFFNVRVNSRWSRDQRVLCDFKVASLIGPIHVKVYGLLLKKNHLLDDGTLFLF